MFTKMNEYINSDLDFMKATATDEQIVKFILRKGDVIATKDSESPDDIGVTALVTEDFDNVVCGYHLTHIKPSSIFGDYLFRWFQTQYLKSYFEVSANGVTRFGLGVDKFNSTLVLTPPLEEQKAIASYLDHKTAEIDKLIAQKERLIELYEEEKTAIINEAVTKGINPDVKLKPSGIDWLGDIPEHWEVKKLKYSIKSLESGVSVNSIDVPVSDGNYGILKTSCVYRYIFDPQENKEILSSELDRAKVNPRKGAIIISRMNTPDLVGASGYVDQDYDYLFLPDRLWQTVFYKNVNICTKWLSFVLKGASFRKLLSILATGTSSSMKNIGQEDFLNIEIPFPSLEEQKAIASYIEKECTRIDTKIAKTKRIIELQKEYRTALISEAVTGKVKVPQVF